MKENNEKKVKNSKENSKLIKAFPKHIAALDKRSVLANVNSKGSGRQKPSPREIPKVREDNENEQKRSANVISCCRLKPKELI